MVQHILSIMSIMSKNLPHIDVASKRDYDTPANASGVLKMLHHLTHKDSPPCLDSS